MTIKTITRSGITVVRGRRNCLKGLNGLNQQQKKSLKRFGLFYKLVYICSTKT